MLTAIIVWLVCMAMMISLFDAIEHSKLGCLWSLMILVGFLIAAVWFVFG